MGYNNYYGGSPFSSGMGTFGSSYGAASSSFIPSAARGPFETVESVVHAVSSISMLLESTYGALISSVRSVFAVGEQLARMKNQMGHLYAALAFTRLISWFKEHFGWILGRQPTPDLIWTNAVIDKEKQTKAPYSQWPLIMYMAFLIGAPYLTWRFVKSTGGALDGSDNDQSQSWMTGDTEYFAAQAEYNFEASRQDELSFQAGDGLKIAPSDLQTSGNRGWLLATVDGTKSGLVPANRIKILGRKIPDKLKSPEKLG